MLATPLCRLSNSVLAWTCCHSPSGGFLQDHPPGQGQALRGGVALYAVHNNLLIKLDSENRPHFLEPDFMVLRHLQCLVQALCWPRSSRQEEYVKKYSLTNTEDAQPPDQKTVQLHHSNRQNDLLSLPHLLPGLQVPTGITGKEVWDGVTGNHDIQKNRKKKTPEMAYVHSTPS